MHRVLIVEDHPESRAWLASLVGEAFPDYGVDQAGTLAQGRQRVAEHVYHLALVDLSLPDGSGLDLVRSLAECSPDTYVVVVTIHDDDRHVFTALETGAAGYLLKDQPRARVLAQLQGIARGEPPLSPAIARKILRSFRRASAGQADGQVPLTEREVEVLHLLSRGFNRNDIAHGLGITANTVAGHVKNIYRKLNVSGRAEATLQAVRLGIIDSDG